MTTYFFQNDKVFIQIVMVLLKPLLGTLTFLPLLLIMKKINLPNRELNPDRLDERPDS